MPDKNIFQIDEPSHDKVFDTHAHDYNARHIKHAVRAMASSPVRKDQGRHLTELIKL